MKGEVKKMQIVKEKPFFGLKVYYSGSIRGVPEPNLELPWNLVQYMIKGGANVLSEHVAARSPEEMRRIRERKLGERAKEVLESSTPWVDMRKMDIEWVDQATHLIALVNGPSHGVGMEIQRALDKPRMGLNRTLILCLVREDLFNAGKLTLMIKGLEGEVGFYLEPYVDEKNAKRIIFNFLTGRVLG